jgi:DEAD/DEAH box helicase domain-containing protein
VASGLLGLISRDRSISPRDIDAAHSNIALLTESGPKRLTDAVVIYDSVYGGLRLTEGLYDDIGRYVAQLEKAAELAGDDALTPADVAENLKSWIETLAEGAGEPARPLDVPEGWFQVYKPGSIVSIMIHGSLVERELVEPRLVDAFGTGMKTLYYQYKKNGGTAFVPHDQVQPTGDAWAWALWNPVTSEYRELDDDNEGEPTT